MQDLIEMLEQLLDSSAMSCNQLSDDTVELYVDGMGTYLLKITQVEEE